ncbi:MAG: substrate-binding domain-containing protein [Anaerolineales bacterium]|nr:substrate-binding domain-containing protein [Anaerolineales bacterium]
MLKMRTWLTTLAAGALLLGACAPAAAVPPTATTAATSSPVQVLRLATTTSTADTGLLDAILPAFEAAYNAQVDVVAVGTGQALELGQNGDADVLLVHARAREDKFVADGDGINRLDVMYNDFILVGPSDDPVGVQGLPTAQEALTAIAAAGATFVSRGDDSGTHTKEKGLWASAGITPTAENTWYLAIGQGMGETLTFANEKPGYTLTDRGTWLAQKANLPNLAVMVGGNSIDENGDKALLNPYGVIPVNPEKHPGVNFDLATQFANWITSVETQQLISDFGRDKFGQALFYPSSAAWKAAHP